MVSEQYLEKNRQYTLSTYASFPLVLEEGFGCKVRDVEGKEYLDFVAGIAVNLLGHGHKKLAQAIFQQAEKLIHCSNLYINRVTIDYMELLLEESGFDRVFLCNSGTESIEAALKLSRRWAGSANKAGRNIVALEGSFHGRTYGSLSATGQKKYQTPFLPLLPGIRFAPVNNAEALEEVVDETCCAIILEPVQGEGGVLPLSEEFLKCADALRKKHDLLLVFDEVQCGFGRTGRLFAWEHSGIKPDILCMAKGIAGGFPMGGILVQERAAAFVPGDHAATFGGNPLACAAAMVVLTELKKNGLLERAAEKGEFLGEQLKMLKEKHPCIQEIRGISLMRGIVLASGSSQIITECIKEGLLLVRAGQEVVRMVPPLIVSEDEIREAVTILDKVLDRMESEGII
jgi:acetylornithine/N-succinyldiaminopimelate aminotransferase